MTQDAIISRERSLSVMWLLLQPRPLASHTDSVSGLSTGFAVSVTEPPSDVADACSELGRYLRAHAPGNTPPTTAKTPQSKNTISHQPIGVKVYHERDTNEQHFSEKNK